MALATVLLVGIVMLSDFGLQQVVVRSPNGENKDFLDTVWTVQVGHGAAVGGLLLSIGAAIAAAQSAGWIAPGNTYSRAELPWVLVGLSLQAVLAGCVSTNFHLAMRRMEIGRVVALEITCQIISLCVIAAWAYFSPSVAALVAGNLTATICKLFAARFFLPGPPNRLCLSRPALTEIRSYGAWVFVASMLSFVIGNFDKLVLGAVLSPKDFGLYAIALTLMMALHEFVLQISNRIAFPSLSATFRDNPQHIGSQYYRLRLPFDAFCLVMAGLLATAGDLLVDLLYDERYAEAGLYLRIFAISLIGVRFVVLSDAFKAMGRPRLLLNENVSRLVMLLAGIFLGLHFFGTVGVVFAVGLSMLAAPAISVFYIQRKLGFLEVRRELLVLPFIAVGAILGLAVRSLV